MLYYMKKYFLIHAFVFVVITGYGQNETGYHYSSVLDMISIQTGINFSKLYGKNQDAARFLVGYFIAAGLRIPVCTNFFINPSIGFFQAGSKYTQGDSYHLGYADAEADAEYDWCEPDIYVQAGVRIRKNLSAKFKYSGVSSDVKYAFKSSEEGIDVGLC